jgi:light-regulated signal transduction histidine kinase (bacteriophytochrome)
MIDVMLVLTRGRDAVDPGSAVELADVAHDAWEEANTHDATVEMEVDIEIQADETYLRHLFRNLFENAVEHGGTDVTVTVGDLPTGFYVADDGSESRRRTATACSRRGTRPRARRVGPDWDLRSSRNSPTCTGGSMR